MVWDPRSSTPRISQIIDYDVAEATFAEAAKIVARNLGEDANGPTAPVGNT
jgi:hypothetical protein